MKSISLKKRLLDQFTIQELHEESKIWLSTIAFWKDEVKFMHHLINENFVYFLSNDEKGSLNALLKKITEIEKNKLDTLKTKVIHHEKTLSNYLQYGKELDEEKFKNDHENISKEFDFFQNNYRLVKSEIFRFAENVLKKKDIKQILS